MQFRTEIEIPSVRELEIDHSMRLLTLGSCFSDNIAEPLGRDGFSIVRNPMGALYNPVSILTAMRLALGKDTPLMAEHDGKWHCLNFCTKYTAPTAHEAGRMVEEGLDKLRTALVSADVLMLTLGTAYVYEWENGTIVGNCHKIPARRFSRRMLSIDEIESALRLALELHPGNVIFTVSPIRHTADTLHGNQLSKAALLTAIDRVADRKRVHYFPAYEILMDDLRDYRYYAADMKHPSDTAVEYIYEIFSKYYFTEPTAERARLERKVWLRGQHRTINPD